MLGGRHLQVEKRTRAGRTVIGVAPLGRDDRVEEVVECSEEARRAVSVPHAEAILKAARRKRR
jgi:DNA repair ATPase RecN